LGAVCLVLLWFLIVVLEMIGPIVSMSFSSSSHTLTLHNAVLGAQCRNENGDFVGSTLDLNRYLSNLNGEFHFKSNPFATGFVHGAKNITLDGAVLSASLPNDRGSLSSAFLNLNFCVANVNGKLVFKRP
jgi:CVNH domain